MNDWLKWVVGLLGSGILAAVIGTTRFCFNVPVKFVSKSDYQPEKFVLKADCQHTADKMHRENREDHIAMFRMMDDLKKEVAETQKETQNLILCELAKK